MGEYLMTDRVDDPDPGLCLFPLWDASVRAVEMQMLKPVWIHLLYVSINERLGFC